MTPVAGRNPPDSAVPFRFCDGERTIFYGRGALDRWRTEMPDDYMLLATPRSIAAVPSLAENARAVLFVPVAPVAECAGALRSAVHDGSRVLVAIGGGRVIDTAKALAAVTAGGEVHALPTTLSGAEMTSLHRHALGVAEDHPRVRARVVVNDPAISASQNGDALWAGAANALAHAVEAPLTRAANPLATAASLDAIALISDAVAAGAGGEGLEAAHRDSLALGALLAGYAIGSASYGLHHVLAQVLAANTPVNHGHANAVMLAHSVRHLRQVMPTEFARAFGDGRALESVAVELARCAGAERLRDLGIEKDILQRCAEIAGQRVQLANTPPIPGELDLRRLYEGAW